MKKALGIYYTYQHEAAWHQALKRGYLEASGEHALFMDPDYDDFKIYYDWMVEQYEKRTDILMNGNYPIWCWDEFPDLGRDGHIDQGAKGIVLTVEIPDEAVLASEFQYWHIVLNNGYIFESYDEENADYDDSHFSKEEIRKSWERIFDRAWCESTVTNQPSVGLTYQYVTHRIELTQVRAVMPFVGRGDNWLDRVKGMGWRIGYKLGFIRSKPFEWKV